MIQFSVFFLVAILNLGLAEKECKEEDLRDCLSSLQHSVIDHFHDLGKLNKDKYCHVPTPMNINSLRFNLKGETNIHLRIFIVDTTNILRRTQLNIVRDVDKGKRCMDDAFQNCGDKHTHMSYLISSFYIYLNQICTEKGKMYMDIAPCLQHHASEFDKCKTDDNQHDNPMDDICRETDYLKCVASLAKKVCDKGESFGQAVEEHVANLHSNVCSSTGSLAANYWKLLILILVGLFLKRSGAEISFFF